MFPGANRHCLRMLSVTVPYTFSVKTKWRLVVLWIIAAHPLAVAFCPHRPTRTFYDRQSRCLGSLVAIQQRALEEIANNSFELNEYC